MEHIVNKHSGDQALIEDIHTERMQLSQLLTECAAHLQCADSAAGLTAAAAAVARILPLHLMFVIECEHDRTRLSRVPFAWSAAGAITAADHDALTRVINARLQAVQLTHSAARARPIVKRNEESVLSHTAAAVTIMYVPIRVDQTLWGLMAFEASATVDWTTEQRDFLRVFAGVAGPAMVAHRVLQQLRHHERLLSTLSAVAARIKPGIDLYLTIYEALESIGQALNADRACVIEQWQTPRIPYPSPLLRSSWQAPHIELGLDSVLRSLVQPLMAEVVQWAEPLMRGETIIGKRSSVPPAVKKLFESSGGYSSLLLPIMMDGEYWGHLAFDNCHQEYDWLAVEIDAVGALAEAIGNAVKYQRIIDELSKANAIVYNSSTILYRVQGEPSFPMIYVSPNISTLGFNAKDLLESPTLYQSFIHSQDRFKVQAAMAELLSSNTDGAVIEYRLHSGDNRLLWVETSFRPVRDNNGHLVEVEAVTIDITLRKQAEERAILLSRTDALTGIANRGEFIERLDRAFAAAKRGNAPFAVLFVDLDRFKQVNDVQGHGVGDKLLKEVAQRLSGAVRETDLAARLGGDEFAVLLMGVDDAASCAAIADKLVTKLCAPYTVDTHELHIGASIGIAMFCATTASGEALLAQADRALYRAKGAGRGQVCFDPEQPLPSDSDSPQFMDTLRNLSVMRTPTRQ